MPDSTALEPARRRFGFAVSFQTVFSAIAIGLAKVDPTCLFRLPEGDP